MGTQKWTLDPSHSEMQFKVRHMMITNVTGSFTAFNVEASTEEHDFSTAAIRFSADVNSISTNNEQRDGHLKSADFFDAAQFPAITFESSALRAAGGGEYTLEGTLTIKGVSKPVVLQVEAGGIAVDPYGNTKAGFTLSGKISRGEFGLTWNAALETGGVMVSDEVKIQAEIQLVKQ